MAMQAPAFFQLLVEQVTTISSLIKNICELNIETVY